MNKIMTHVVAGYPSEADCINLLKSMDEAGVHSFEVQIPFSDPIADGETIMRANDRAIEQKMTTKKSFELINKANLECNVYIMSYFQKIHAFGVEEFCRTAKEAEVKGLIVPDLPFDAREYDSFFAVARANNLSLVPVISPGMNMTRLDRATKSGDLIYLTSMRGITGKKFELSQELIDTASKVRKLRPDSELAIGFGVSNENDAAEVLKVADIAIVGSEVIRKINDSGVESAANFVKQLTS